MGDRNCIAHVTWYARWVGGRQRAKQNLITHAFQHETTTESQEDLVSKAVLFCKKEPKNSYFPGKDSACTGQTDAPVGLHATSVNLRDTDEKSPNQIKKHFLSGPYG